jgi:hypothetical protein
MVEPIVSGRKKPDKRKGPFAIFSMIFFVVVNTDQIVVEKDRLHEILERCKVSIDCVGVFDNDVAHDSLNCG